MSLAQQLDRLNTKFLLLQFTLTKQLDFLEGLFFLMSDGIAARDALRLAMNTGDPLDRGAARIMLEKLHQGLHISSGMRSLFREDLASAVAAAEQSENFAAAGQKVVEHMREQLASRQNVTVQLLRPIAYMAIAAGLYAMFSAQIWPKFEELSPVDSWHELAQINYRVGQFILDYWIFIILGLVLASYGARLLLRRWVGLGRQQVDRLWPLSLYRGLIAAHVMEFLGTMLVAGHDFRTALATVVQHSTPYSHMYLTKVRRRLRDGYSIPRSLDIGLFTAADMSRLKLLAEFQGLHGAMVKMGASSRQSILTKLKIMAGTLNTFGLILVAAAYAGLVASLYLNSSTMPLIGTGMLLK